NRRLVPAPLVGLDRPRVRAHADPALAATLARLPPADHPLAVRRSLRAEGPHGGGADVLALTGLADHEIDFGITLALVRVGERVGGRREPRREPEVSPAGEVAHVGAVLIHQREPFDTPLLRTGFVDEDDADVEIALLAGDPLVDGVGNDVGDASPITGGGVV